VPLVRGEYGIMTTILNALPLSMEDKQALLENYQLPFEAFFSTLNKHSDIETLLKIFSIGQRNTNHLFLAKLAKYGLLKTIVTTNFTRFIEQALEHEGLRQHDDFDVIYSDEQMLHADFSDNKIKVIKIHGCISDTQSLIITIEKIADQTSLSPRKKIIDHLFNSGSHNAVLFLGYSCSDVFDITPFIKESDCDKEVIFIKHTLPKDEGYDTHCQIHQADEKDLFAHVHKGIWYRYNTDQLIQQLWQALYLRHTLTEPYIAKILNQEAYHNEQQKVLAYVQNWIENIQTKEQEEVPYFISGELLNNITRKKEALKYYEKIVPILETKQLESQLSQTLAHLSFLCNSLNDSRAQQYSLDGLKIAQKIGNIAQQQTLLKNLAVFYRRENNIDSAVENFQKAINLDPDNTKVSAKIYMELGILYKQIEKYESANDYFKKALKLFEAEGSLTDQGWAVGNIGNIYYHFLEDYTQAETYYKKALEIAEHMAHEYNRQVWSGNLGNLYLNQERYPEAKKYLDEALSLSVKIGDSVGEGKWLSNLSAYYDCMDEKEKAVESMQKSVEIAKKYDRMNLEKRLVVLEEYEK
jgi:tetratricopeptide (TPR) repeat protein